jgi:hypothetical protein
MLDGHYYLPKGAFFMLKCTFSSYSTNAKRRTAFFSLFGVLLMLFFLLTACGEEGSTPDSKQLLTQAQEAMKQVNTYHFNLKTDSAGVGSAQDINIQTAEGDVKAPDRIKATGTISYQGFTVPGVTVIAVGEKDYYTDPLTRQWKSTSGFDARTLANPQAGVSILLGGIQQPGVPTSSSVDNRDCWSIAGKLSTQYIAGIIGSSAAKSGNVDTTVCIGKSDHRLYQIEIKGIVIQGDSDQTKRTITFSKFNDPVTIEAPA